MELIRGLHNIRPRHNGCVGTIGAFDGVHCGHQQLISQLLVKARELNVPALVVCFEPLPREYFAPGDAPARIMSFAEKTRHLENLGLDRILRIKFNEALSKMSAAEFVDDILVAKLGIRHLVIGDDFRVGKNREGDADFLIEHGAKAGYTVSPTDSITVAGQRVSSSLIRKMLGEAQFEDVAAMLGRPYSIVGKVVYGRQLGRGLGVPTANLELHRFKSPLAGVYIVDVTLADGRRFSGVANVGTRPTIGDRTKANLEVHLLDFAEDIYGKTIEVHFKERLRDEKKFASLDELKSTIYQDIHQARNWLAQQN